MQIKLVKVSDRPVTDAYEVMLMHLLYLGLVSELSLTQIAGQIWLTGKLLNIMNWGCGHSSVPFIVDYTDVGWAGICILVYLECLLATDGSD